MSRIRSKHTEPEMEVSAALSRRGLRFVRHYGWAKVDFAFPREKVAIFVDGCFWHGCDTHRRSPVSNASYWEWKVKYNRARDRRNRSKLRRDGWIVLRVWEHSLPKLADRYAEEVERLIQSRSGRPALRPRRRGSEVQRSRLGQSAPYESR
jgi:DNA mismatch endonuclease, patch repair protein